MMVGLIRPLFSQQLEPSTKLLWTPYHKTVWSEIMKNLTSPCQHTSEMRVEGKTHVYNARVSHSAPRAYPQVPWVRESHCDEELWKVKLKIKCSKLT